ncbi:MAG: serine/threonine protein kinase [Gemmataceae bacterium]|nr:serine/threonine protein kinase [Gemmataceae bacterium]
MRSGRSLPCAPTTASQFLDALRASRLLPLHQIDALEIQAQARALQAESLVHELIDQGVLTAYQAGEVLAGCGEALTLGQYRILDQLGVGGMSRVYKAEHRLMKRVVALKLLSLPWRPDAPTLGRFYQEVQVASQLCHPHIVTVYDADEVDGVPFLVMEYVEGVDLERFVQEEGPLPLALACECIRQVALGLQHAHERGFVHGDIKPSNLLLQPGVLEGCPLVKILDFGLARLAGTPLVDTHTFPRNPAEESFAGTPDFLAPEQARSDQTADIRSDLYSLGCTFYYLLTGHVPYPGGSIAEKLLRHQLDPATPVTQWQAETPPEIAIVVHRLLAKDPAERFALPADLALVLQEWLCGHQDPLDLTPQAAPAWTADTRPAVESPTMLSPGRECAPVILAFPHGSEEKATRGVEDQNVVPEGASPRSGRRPWSWPVAVAGAVAFGIATAWVARLSPMPAWTLAPAPSPTLAQTPAFVTLASMPDRSFAGLEAAVAAARAEDTVVLHGEGPFRTRPLAIQGKALTLRAEAGSRPRVELAALPTDRPWQALLATDRPLVLEGLELGHPGREETRGPAGATYLVYADPARVRLLRCRLLSPQGTALLVCRRTQHLELTDCLLLAHASACCVEVGAGPVPVLELRGNTFEVKDRRGAALAVWAGEDPTQAAIKLLLERNRLEAGRIAAFAGLTRGVEIRAQDNTFAFHEALLSFVGFPGPEGCRRATRWCGARNRYQASADWLCIDGQPDALRSLKEWQTAWPIQELGSSERSSQHPVRTSLVPQPQQPR